MSKTLVYIAGPYTHGDVAVNVANAIDLAEALAENGYVCIIPHLAHVWHMMHPHRYEFWMERDFELLARCDALIYLPGISPGTDREVAYAHDKGIPVFDKLSELQERFPVK